MHCYPSSNQADADAEASRVFCAQCSQTAQADAAIETGNDGANLYDRNTRQEQPPEPKAAIAAYGVQTCSSQAARFKSMQLKNISHLFVDISSIGSFIASIEKHMLSTNSNNPPLTLAKSQTESHLRQNVAFDKKSKCSLVQSIPAG